MKLSISSINNTEVIPPSDGQLDIDRDADLSELGKMGVAPRGFS